MIFGRGGGGGVINRVDQGSRFRALARIHARRAARFEIERFTTDLNQPLSKTSRSRVNGVYEGADSFRDFVDRKRYGINPTLTLVARTSNSTNRSATNTSMTVAPPIAAFHRFR